MVGIATVTDDNMSKGCIMILLKNNTLNFVGLTINSCNMGMSGLPLNFTLIHIALLRALRLNESGLNDELAYTQSTALINS